MEYNKNNKKNFGSRNMEEELFSDYNQSWIKSKIEK